MLEIQNYQHEQCNGNRYRKANGGEEGDPEDQMLFHAESTGGTPFLYEPTSSLVNKGGMAVTPLPTVGAASMLGVV